MADVAVESYWMALCRDVNFTQYGNEPISQAAIAELNSLSAFAGPHPVTPQNLFRGFTPGDVLGPYPSQFILQPFSLRRYPHQAADDHLRPRPRLHDRSGFVARGAKWPEDRSLANNRTPTSSTFATAAASALTFTSTCCSKPISTPASYLVDTSAPLDPNNPYVDSRTQTGFGTFGSPHLKTIVAEVSQRALKAVWYHEVVRASTSSTGSFRRPGAHDQNRPGQLSSAS